MREITITANDAGRRLDRFLRKYLPDAPLSEIYRMIRKDVKVDSKRRSESYILNEGETLTLYLSDEAFDRLSGGKGSFGAGQAGLRGAGAGAAAVKVRRNFGIVYEDDAVLIASKPFGLLTHGDSHEKKNHLANQVKDYLIATGSYDPRSEKVFTPAPVNRLDRNTTGIVLFGKTAAAVRGLARLIREDEVRKFYLTIACGTIEKELHLGGSLVKDEAANKVRITDGPAGNVAEGRSAGRSVSTADIGSQTGHAGSEAETETEAKAKRVETIVRPLEHLSFGEGGRLKATLCEVELVTGRSHQIRAHLAAAGHPLMGDSKYADDSSGNTARVNRFVRDKFGLTTQLLHACRIEFSENLDSFAGSEELGHLAGRSFEAAMPKRSAEILTGLGSRYKASVQ